MSERLQIDLIARAGREQLPIVLMRLWRQWFVGTDGLVEIPTPGNEGDWLDPRHVGELWVPEGLPNPSPQPALQFLIKDGELRYMMPAMPTFLDLGERRYWNRGLRTQPLAHTWVNCLGLSLGTLKLAAYRRSEDEPWAEVLSPQRIDGALSRLIQLLADGPEPLLQGFHFIAIPIGQPLECASPDDELGLLLSVDPSEPANLEADEAPCASLRVSVCASARLSDSYRQPEVYAALIAAEDDS